jgi:quinol-cytochrome oxidoreductase complex cytochrome b subunit/mono/diheme cytochrome c family protein
MLTSLVNWLEDRTGIRGLMHEALFERVPGGARWRYVWGSTLVFTFAVQMITGLMLWTAYSPSSLTAWESVFYIQHVMFLGDIVRGIHHYSAQAMVVLMAIHLIQVIIDGAYRAPRELNFWLGLVLLQIVLGLSLTGYLLPWDQKGYYATQVTTNIMSATPVVGQQIQVLAQGGTSYGHMTVTRFFAMHAGILPLLLMGFLALHIYVFRRHGLTVKEPRKAPDTTFWPDQVLKDCIACLAVLAVVLLLAVFKGAELSAPADPAVKFDAARPEWYFLFLFRFLRFEEIDALGLAVGAIVIPGVLFFIIAVMPITAKLLGPLGHTLNRAFIWLMAFVVVGLTGLAIYDDQNDSAHQAALAESHRDAQRAIELASGPNKIPIQGAVSLMRNDPFTRGPRLFAQHCAGCHRWNGHDGRGSLVSELVGEGDTKQVELAKPTAVDLGGFAQRNWMRSVVTDYPGHFAWLTNASWFHDAKNQEDDGAEVVFLDPENSEMADWSGDSEALKSAENAGNLDALVEFLTAEAGHAGTVIDEQLAATGRSVAVDGAWSGALEGTSCADCHSTIGEEFTVVPDDEADGYPSMARYGSQAWLRDFIRNPGAARHYGQKNRMPTYGRRQLSNTDLDLLVRWMTGDFAPTNVKDYPSQLSELDPAR